MAAIPLDVAHMADGVRQRKWVGKGAEDLNSLLITIKRCIQVLEVSFHLAQANKRLRKQRLAPYSAAFENSRLKQTLRILRTVFPPCLVALM